MGWWCQQPLTPGCLIGYSRGMGGGNQSAKDGYVKDSVESRLEVSKNLGI